MMRKSLVAVIIMGLSLCCAVGADTPPEFAATNNPVVRIKTNLGVIELELFRDKAPITVANFLAYVDNGFYVGTIFHRVVRGFVIQGGGMRSGMEPKPTFAPIKNEADNGLHNLVGTIAMARTSDPNSATSQFFINTVDNSSLDHRDNSVGGWGYAVFGRVTRGMDVVHKIESVPTHRVGPYIAVPVQDVMIENIEVLRR
jgi:cyclophilin family peptidyl-prolyl cis-trans isomerase